MYENQQQPPPYPHVPAHPHPQQQPLYPQVPPYNPNYPPPGGYQNAPPQATVTIVHAPNQLGPLPQRMTCPSCRADVMTKTDKTPSIFTHLCAILLCGICCCCVPYCMDACYTANHYCPQCNAYIGKQEISF